MKCIIIDDEPIARKGMVRLAGSRPEIDIAATFDSALSAMEWLAENKTDLILLDIEMPKLNGIEFARKIPDETMVIFTTAYSEYALEGFEVDALDYLMKPVDPSRFNKAIDKAIAYQALIKEASKGGWQEDPEHIVVKADRKYIRIKLQDILYVEGLKDYLSIRLADKRIVVRKTIKSMEEILPKHLFLRVSKSFIVNKSKIDSFDNNDLNIGSTEIAIGQAYRESVMSELLKKSTTTL